MSAFGSKVRSGAVPFVALAAASAFIWAFNGEYPVREWLLTRVLGYWVLSLYWGVGCLALGLEILRRVAPHQYRPTEAPFLGFPLGLLAFGIVVFVVGLFHGLGTAFFVLCPFAFLLAGFRALAAEVRALLPLRQRLVRPWTWTELAALVFGATGFVAVYVPLLTPHNLEHDARWYHLPIAQQYASLGAVTRFPEGWFLGAYPHLASYLYTWAFLLPAGIVHRIELAAHLEFVAFVVTVLAVPSMVRRILPGVRLPLAWAGFFLFPGFLVYDSNLSTGADHIAAVFAPLGLLALFPTLRTLSPRHAALVGAAAAGAAMTKYSALSVAAPLLAFVVARSLYFIAKKRHVRRAALSAGSAIAAFVVLTSPHFVKNALWYGNPFYPMLSGAFPSRPWDGQAAMSLRVFLEWGMLRPSRDFAGILQTLGAVLTLGFRQEDKWRLGAPLFGFLFAATLYCLPFTRPSWRSQVAHGLGFSAAFVWYFTNHHDRYLQACLPWLVAATLGVLFTLYRSEERAVRMGAAALVLAQVVAGTGLSLVPSYFMVPGEHPLPHVVKLVGQGYSHVYAARFEPFEEWNFAAWTTLGKQLPKGGKVLVHEDRLWLGLDAPVVVDELQWQAGIRYSSCADTADVYDLLRRFEVTHVVTGTNYADGGDHGIPGNLLFSDFITSSATRIDHQGGLTLWKLPEARPLAVTPGNALVLTCNLSIAPGLYAFSEISRGVPRYPVASGARVPSELRDQAAYAVVEDECDFAILPTDFDAFHVVTTRGKVTYWKRGAP